MALLGLAAAGHQGLSGNLYTTESDMFSTGAVGNFTGIGGMAGSVGAMLLLSLSTGRIRQVIHDCTSLFVIAGSAYLIALAVLQSLAPRLRRARWERA